MPSLVVFVATAVGGTLALWATAALAVLAGGWLGRRVRVEMMEKVAAWVFVAIGLLLVVSLVLPITII